MFTDQTRQHIAQLSDASLAEYIQAGEEMYDPAAIAFAQQEFSRRNLDPQVGQKLNEEADQRLAVSEAVQLQRAIQPLDWGWRLLILFFSPAIAFSFLGFIFWLRFQRRGAVQKSRDVWQFSLIGIGLWGLILTFARLLSADNAFQRRGAAVPIAIYSAIILLFAIPVVLGHRRRKRLVDVSHCRTCGYDLRASQGRCPECGTRILPQLPS